MNNQDERDNDALDDRDLEIGRPHGPREDEEERDGLRVTRDEREPEEDLFEDEDEDAADEGDLDFEPDDDRM